MWYTCDGDTGRIDACASWEFTHGATWTDKKICVRANGSYYFEGEDSTPTDPDDPTDPTSPSDGLETAEFENSDYYIYAFKYDNGWLSAYGEFINGGKDGGLTITLPGGYEFVDTRYNFVATSTDAEQGGAIDGFKILARTKNSFTVATSHLEDELVLEMTDENYSFSCSGRWK